MEKLLEVVCCGQKPLIETLQMGEGVKVLISAKAVSAELAKIIEERSKVAIREKNCFYIGLSGGSLCNLLCIELPNITTDWSKWKLFFCDERIVPFDDDNSTFKLYREHLCTKVPIEEKQFVTINPKLSAKEAAADYEQKLRQLFPNEMLPKFDLLLLGIGPDGHTCSLFPGHPQLNEQICWVASIEDSPKPPPCRVTLTYPVINNSHCSIFVATGSEKAQIIKQLLKDGDDLPASRVKSNKVIWLLDERAAQLL